MQAQSPTDRLACAVFSGEKAIQRAVSLLVEAGFATESISVVWCREHDPSDEPDSERAPTPLSGTGRAQDADDEADDVDEAPVVLRTGVRRFLPIGAALGALGGALLVWFDGDPAAPFVPQVITALATGGFLGAMGGIVLGLGQWEHFVELPESEPPGRPLLIAVDIAAQGREPEARAALGEAGAALVKVCTREEAEQFVREASESAA
ncbi:MAG TPA: hypothetical protein VI197_14785 [Polyangiaceae bacterium]